MPRRTSLVPCLLAFATACAPSTPVALPVVCREIGDADGGSDTVRVVVHLDSVAPGSTGEALVRVDPLGAGNVSFETPPPPTAVALSAAFSVDGVFHGCFAEDPGALFVRTPAAPRAKAWLRLSSNRVVRVRVETGAPGPAAVPVSEWMVVAPGASARGRWVARPGP